MLNEPAPVAALAGRDAVVHLAGENVAQRWSAEAKRAIRETRVTGTRNLLAGLRAVERSQIGERPRTLVSASAIGYYGAHGEEPLDEDAPAGCGLPGGGLQAMGGRGHGGAYAGDAGRARAHGRRARRRGGALAKMLCPSAWASAARSPAGAST